MSRLGHLARRFARDRDGAAAAEMALVSPMLLFLMLGAMELGKYFLDQHVVVKAVRDGARYAARQPFTAYECDSESVSAYVVERTRNLTRTGQMGTGGTPRLTYWTDSSDIEVIVECDSSGDYEGIYRGSDGALIVTVSASVDYIPLLGSIGFSVEGLRLNAQSQSAVAGA